MDFYLRYGKSYAQGLIHIAYAAPYILYVYANCTKPPITTSIASNRERQMNARATATQAGYMHHIVTAVSLSLKAAGKQFYT